MFSPCSAKIRASDKDLTVKGAKNELNQESNVRFFDSKIEQNKEQKLAVTSIVK